MIRLRPLFQRFRHSQAGSATVEFVIAVPIVLTILFSAIDFGAVMLRQVFLDRAVDIAVREVRLGNVPSGGLAGLRARICEGTILIADCNSRITVELKPINTHSWGGLNSPIRCINQNGSISPSITFNPSNGNQDLMLVRVCASADPFISLTGLVMGMELDGHNGDYLIVSISSFTNEPT